MNTEHEIVLLLTSSINPTINTPDVGVPDPKVRESQYLFALNFYVELGYPIVFVDSSNTMSDDIVAAGNKTKDFEYHTFASLNSYLGKGAGEKDILDFAFQNSSLLSIAKRVIKITGRYRIDNLKDIIEKVKKSKADVHINFGLNLTRSDSRMIIFKPFFYADYFEPSLKEYDFEFALARSVHQLMADKGIYEPWPVYPFYNGVNGSTGKQVGFNWLKKKKFILYYHLKLWFQRQII